MTWHEVSPIRKKNLFLPVSGIAAGLVIRVGTDGAVLAHGGILCVGERLTVVLQTACFSREASLLV